MHHFFFPLLFLFAGGFFFAPIVSQAAQLHFDGSEIFLNTEGQRVNAIEGTLEIPSGSFLDHIRNANSIVSFWIEPPTFRLSATGTIIRWSGIIPGGFNGQKGLLFDLVFAPSSDRIVIPKLLGARAFTADGQATELSVGLTSVRSGSQPKSIPDTTPPQSFSINIVRHPQIFNGEWFAVFSTQDKESGVAGYRVFESAKRFDLADPTLLRQAWIAVISPYHLTNQSRQQYLYVDATDQAGNHRLTVQPPPSSLIFRWLISLAILVSVAFLFWLLRSYFF
ncbi:hypothetical protein EXS71_03920 [Candidatus Uhrbacteria bacterium]|nr:hypothetical protein [Candidatus Uhrbacteria bacterium]